MPIETFEKQIDEKLVLGIDLGSNSIGLALIEANLGRIIHTTSRIFPAGMTGNELDWQNGKEASNAAQRRQARGQRRLIERRARRLRKLFHLLRSFGWLPSVRADELQDHLNRLDLDLAKRYKAHANLPYFLRARALDYPLEQAELGRALYHLAQRRGFKSNRKTAPKSDDNPGEVYAGIDSIKQAILAAGKRTLGEYFASLDPEEQKVRRNWTHRDMFVEEFALIWEAQQKHNPEILTDERRDLVFNTIFFQRPLKDQSDLVGSCELEPLEKRAPLRFLEVQRYRYLSALNNLRLYSPEKVEYPITQQQREGIIAELELNEKLTFNRIRKLLGLKGGYFFSIETGGEKQIPGNATAARIYAIVPVFWASLSASQKDDLVEDIGDGNRFETDEELCEGLISKWKLVPDEAEKLSRTRVPDGYSSLSLAAIRKLAPHLAAGAPFAAAKHAVYPPKFDSLVLDLLPPVKDVIREVRNPAVLRSLTEMRKCVNAFIRKFGKPEEIHIELARDLRRSKKERMEMTKSNRTSEKIRERAIAELNKNGHHNPSNQDIEKFILWEECNRICPYSGSAISYKSLFDEPRFEVEHIIPYSRSLDNSRANKTLCRVDVNKEKGNKTPVEAFAGTDAWDSMVERFKSFASPGKLKRFLLAETDTEKILDDFSQRQLNDTKYASKLAQRYLASLYGGIAGNDGQLRIITCAGAITSILRRIWDMNRVLNEVPEKSRDDHRHHAVDAVAIALCNKKYIHAISTASANSQARRHIRSAMLSDPWDGFREELSAQILQRTPVSYRPVRKLSGALHKETIYSPPVNYQGKEYVHVRQSVLEFKTDKDLEAIVDDAVRQAIKTKLSEHAGDANRFKDDPPRLPSGVPIRKARVRVAATTIPVGKGSSARRVVSGDNHHMEVLAVLDTTGAFKSFRASVVSRLEANQRLRSKLPVVNRDHGPQTKFLFSLSEGDMVEFARDGMEPKIYKVRGVTTQGGGMLVLSDASDARLKAEIVKSQALLRPPVNVFMRGNGRKVMVDHLGNCVIRND